MSVTFRADEPAVQDDNLEAHELLSVTATPGETRAAFLKRSSGGYTKLRRSFVQMPRSASSSSKPGPLAAFSRNHRACLLYLAVLSNWPWMRREQRPRPAATWIRFLRSDVPGALTWNEQSLSHAWKTLAAMQLVERKRTGRMNVISPLREDGTGAAYDAPRGTGGDSYLILPDAFWLDEFHARLSWPGLATLLVLLKESGTTADAELPIDRAKAFYGIGRTTAEAGLTELRKEGLIMSSDRWVKDFDSAEGRRRTSKHTLLRPFSTDYRAELRAAAKTRVAGRTAPPGEEEPDDVEATA